MHVMLVVSCLESFTHNLTSTIEVKKDLFSRILCPNSSFPFGKDNQQQLKVLLITYVTVSALHE